MTKREKLKEEQILLNKLADEQPLPESADLFAWIEKTIFPEAFIMFFKTESKGKYLGVCQSCKNEDIHLTSVKSEKTGVCPVCGRKVHYRNAKSKTDGYHLHETEVYTIFQQIETGFVLRNFIVYRYTFSDYINYEYQSHEVERCFVDKEFANERWFSTGVGYKVWRNGIYLAGYCHLPSHNYLYTANILVGTKWNYSGLQEYAINNTINPIIYLQKYASYPQLEFLMKFKLNNLVDDIIKNDKRSDCSKFLDSTKENIKEFLKLKSKTYIDYVLKTNPDIDQLSVIQYLEFQKVIPTKEYIEFAKNIIDYVHWNQPTKYIHDCVNKVGFVSLYNYMQAQNCTDCKLFVSDYFDYIEECIKLKYDINDTMFSKPHDFISAHQKTIQKMWELEIKTPAQKKIESKCKEVLTDLQKLNYASNELTLLIPKTSSEIKMEGLIQHHCVADYIPRVANKTSIIAFVRKKCEIEKPYYTVELNAKSKTIVQCRDYKNLHVGTSEVNRFLDTWLKQVVQKQLVQKGA